MSRIGSDQIFVQPKGNIYTVLAAVAMVVAIFGVYFLFARASEVIAPGALMK